MAAIDWSKFTFGAEQIRGIQELLRDAALNGMGSVESSALFKNIHTVWTKIITDQEVGFLGEGGLLGVKAQGCDPTAQAWSVATRKITWTPKEWEFLVGQCYTELEKAMSVYSLKFGKDIADFTDSDYQSIVLSKIEESVINMIWRYTWFGDTSAKNVTAGGVITDGVDEAYFNIVDGFFKQMIAQSAINPKQRVPITENTETTYVGQALTPDKANDYLTSVIMAAPQLLRNASDKVLLVTQSIYDAYHLYLANSGVVKSEAGYAAGVNGAPFIAKMGIPLQVVPVWDTFIENYEDTATKLNNPHRVVLTTSGVLAVGVCSEEAFESYNNWYEKKERKVYTEGMGKFDAKLADPRLFVIAI